MEEIRLFDLNKEKYENYILKKKIIIICVIGIIVILNIINFLTKKILGLYIPLFSMALIMTQVFDYVTICLNQKYILSIYSNKINIKKENDNIYITLKDKSKKFKKIKTMKSCFNINKFDPLTNTLYLKVDDFKEINFEYKETPLDVKNKILKKCLLISGLIYFVLEIFFIVILKYIPLFLILSFSWSLIISFIIIIVYENLIEKNNVKIFEEISTKIYFNNDKFYYLENNVYKELYITSKIENFNKKTIIDITLNEISNKKET